MFVHSYMGRFLCLHGVKLTVDHVQVENRLTLYSSSVIDRRLSVSSKAWKRDLPPRLNLRNRKHGWLSSNVMLQSGEKNYKIKVWRQSLRGRIMMMAVHNGPGSVRRYNWASRGFKSRTSQVFFTSFFPFRDFHFSSFLMTSQA